MSPISSNHYQPCTTSIKVMICLINIVVDLCITLIKSANLCLAALSMLQ